MTVYGNMKDYKSQESRPLFGVRTATLIADPTTTLTPFAAGECAFQKQQSIRYSITESSSATFYVYHPEALLVLRSVNLEARSCTCEYRDQMHLLCRHIIRALTYVGRLDSILDFFHPMYLIGSYSAAVSKCSLNCH
ncbi:hypothetical protein ACHHYP_20605 [Achlya hypogyna]|uniref:SWIM-type domain-containing protein n=1 Tax=Achlya hypogyna TaxID=1202772 RepID=A0A1V9YHE3_ACHHY|nr:hypothetical protein ACHHYP_20605 [Achlya hypogyna]